VLVQAMIATAGVRAAVLSVGVFFALLLLATATRLRHVDAHADAPVVAIRLLKSLAIFNPLPGPELEGIARSAEPMDFAAGSVIIRTGDVGDRYYAIVTGEVEVDIEHTRIRTMSRGTGFGEIALLADVPRTATVTATTDVSVLAIERVAFLTAVTGHDASARTAWSVARGFHSDLDEYRMLTNHDLRPDRDPDDGSTS